MLPWLRNLKITCQSLTPFMISGILAPMHGHKYWISILCSIRSWIFSLFNYLLLNHTRDISEYWNEYTGKFILIKKWNVHFPDNGDMLLIPLYSSGLKNESFFLLELFIPVHCNKQRTVAVANSSILLVYDTMWKLLCDCV